MSQRPEPWVLDPEDPRAPSQDVWDQLTEEQRQRVVDTLPSDFPVSETHPPEGDHHTEAVYEARTALRRFFDRTGRSIYVGTNLPVYYPGRSMFSPDVMAVDDLEGRLAAAELRAEEESRRAEEAEARLREALAELARLKRAL